MSASPDRTEAELWVLACAAIVTQMESGNFNNHRSIGGWSGVGENAETSIQWARNVSARLYGIQSADDIRRWYDSLIAEPSTDELSDKVEALPDDPSRDNVVQALLRSHRDAVEFYGGVGWDLGRLAPILGWSKLAGYIDEAEYWDKAFSVARRIQHVFGEWKQFADSYQLGRAVWADGAPHAPTSEAIQALLTNPESPWLRLNWGTPLFRRGEGMASTSASAGELVVFPGEPLATLNDYIELMLAMQRGDMNGGLAGAGLDPMTMGPHLGKWQQRLQLDPQLNLQFGTLFAKRLAG